MSSEGVAFGYGNNCGVKGYGYHDHGKPCPNRPFPGHKGHQKGHDLDEEEASPVIAENSATTDDSAPTSHNNGNGTTHKTGTTTTVTTSTSSEQLTANGRHQHGKGPGKTGVGQAKNRQQE
jgi:hypothetical protein